MMAITLTYNFVLKALSLFFLIALINMDNIPDPIESPKYIPPPQNTAGQCDIFLIPLLVLTIGSLFLFIIEKAIDKLAEWKAKNSSTKSQHHQKVNLEDPSLDSSSNIIRSYDYDSSLCVLIDPAPPMQSITASSRRSRKASKINFEISPNPILKNILNQQLIQVLLNVALEQLCKSKKLPEYSSRSYLKLEKASDLFKHIRSKKSSTYNNTSLKGRRRNILQKVCLGRRSTKMR